MQTLEKTHFTSESDLLAQAAENDPQAVGNLLVYLSSPNPNLHQLIMDALKVEMGEKIWQELLHYLAQGTWGGIAVAAMHYDFIMQISTTACLRIDLSIVEAFQSEAIPEVEIVKERAIHNGLVAEKYCIQAAAAYLAGLRGDTAVIPLLARMVETPDLKWQRRAIRALAATQDERAAPIIIDTLAKHRGVLHQEAKRALARMGVIAESALLETLNHPDSHIRWHAARAMGEIGDDRAAYLLAEGLWDDNQAVRWVTADVLARLGKSSVPAILTLLTQHPLTASSRQAIFHALNAMVSRHSHHKLQPLLDALHSPAADLETPQVAQRLLAEWQ